MTLPPKTLYLLRHAAAEAGDAQTDDKARRLTLEGRQMAESAASLFTVPPQLVLCSTAVRTRETLHMLQANWPVCYEDALYLASTNELLTRLAALPDELDTVLIIGHNPGIHELAGRLAASGPTPLLEDLRLHFPTAALATLRLPGWSNLRQAKGELLGLHLAPKHAAVA